MWKKILNGSVFYKYRFTTILLTLLFVILCGAGAKNLYFESSYKAFFAPDNIQRVQFEKIQDQFTKNETVLFTLTPKNGVFTKEFFEAEKWLTKESWKLPKAVRVDSLSNFQHTVAEEDDLLVSDLVEDSNELEDSDRAAYIKSVALKEPLLKNRLVTEEAKTSGVVTSINYDGSPDEIVVVGDAAYKLGEEFRQKFPNIRIGVTGSAILNFAFGVAAQKDSTTIIPLMYLAIIFITFLALRSIGATLLSLSVIILSTVATLGISGHLGFFFTNLSAIVPTVVMTLAIADSIHILKTMLNFMKEGLDKKNAILKSLEVNAKPVFLTSFTTVIGFLSLNLSEVPPYNDLGNMTSIGVVLAYLFSVITLPALVSFTPIKVKNKDEKAAPRFQKLVAFVTNNNKAVLILTALVVIASISSIPKLEFSDEPLKYFSESMSFRRDTDYTIDNLTGVEYIEIALPSKSGSISDPAYLNDLENLKSHFEKDKRIIHISSLTDIVKKLNKTMNGDNEEFYKIPENKELIAQYLLLYELSLLKGLDLGNMVDINKSSSRMVFTFAHATSDLLMEVEEEIEQYVASEMNAIDSSMEGSANLMFAHISKKNLESIIKGALLSFSLITLSLMIILGSFKYGLVSIIGNVLPSIASFGLWSLLIGKADVAVSVASAVTIGVIVDFTVHFLSKYALYRETNSFEDTIKKCFSAVGSPIVSTAFILAFGFGILGISPFRLNWVLGLLSSIMIMFSVFFLFFAMPSILKVIDRK